jgi:sec-independent protein translocase protein TatA
LNHKVGKGFYLKIDTEMLLFIPLFIGTTELLLIAGVALLLFGGKKLPELMRGLGRGVKEFKEGMKDDAPLDADAQQAAKDKTPKTE